MNYEDSTGDKMFSFLMQYKDEFKDEFIYSIDQDKILYFAKKIIDAINQQKAIFIWGDYDVDGIGSTTMLVDIIRDYAVFYDLPAVNISYHIPSRSSGYGISYPHYKILSESADLIITLDNGTHKEFFQKLSSDDKKNILIIDHHPNGDFSAENCVLNPNADGKVKISTGLLVEEIFMGIRMLSEDYKNSRDERFCSDLCALTLISDMASLNNSMIREKIDTGLKVINERKRMVYKNIFPEYKGKIDMKMVAFNLVPILNSIGRLNENPGFAVDVLLSKRVSRESLALLDKAITTNNLRKDLSDYYSKIAYQEIEKNNVENDALIYVHIDESPIGINGLIAANVFNKYGKDSIVTSRNFRDGAMIVGSGRGVRIKGILDDISKMLKAASARCDEVPTSESVFSYGGHDQAVGVKIFKQKEFELARHWACKNVKSVIQSKQLEKLYPFDKNISIAEYKDACRAYNLFVYGDIKYNDNFFAKINGTICTISEYRNDFIELVLADETGEELRILTKRENGVNYFSLEMQVFDIEIQPVCDFTSAIGATTKLVENKNLFNNIEVCDTKENVQGLNSKIYN